MCSTRTYTIQRGMKARILPSTAQKAFLEQNIGCSRKLYNLYVEEGNKRDYQAAAWHKADKNRDNQKYPHSWSHDTDHYDEYPFLKNADSLALMNARKSYMAARKQHFENGAGRPKYHKKNHPGGNSYTTNNQGYKDGKHDTVWIEQTDDMHNKALLHIPKTKDIGGIPVVLSKPVSGIIHSATITHDTTDKWYVSLLVETKITIENQTIPTDNDDILQSFFGGDLGLTDYLVGTDGKAYNDDEDYTKDELRLRIEERKLGKQGARLRKQDRRLSECSNYQKQKKKVARLKRHIADKRRDFRHKLSRGIVNNHDYIFLEDLHVRGMIQNHALSRRISDSAWGDFVRMVRYKAEEAGKTVVLVDRFFPSTRRCSCCGALSGPKGLDGLGIRAWVCPVCGAIHARDMNAAWNVLLEGVRLLSVGDSGFLGVLDGLVCACRCEQAAGNLVSARTGGTSWLAWGEVNHGFVVDDPCMYTFGLCRDVFGHGIPVGEQGVSRKDGTSSGALIEGLAVRSV